MIMNKKLLGLFFFVILAVVFFLAYPLSKKENLPPPIFVEVTKEKTLTKPKKILDLAKDRPSKKLKREDKSNPCSELVTLFSDIAYNEITENIKLIIAFGSQTSCQDEIKNTLKGTVIEAMSEKCFKSAKILKSKQCEKFLINFRAWAINSSFPDDNLAGLDDTVLINKFLWNFSNNPGFKLDKLDKSLTMIDELISRRPDFFAAYKAKLIPLFIKEIKHEQDMQEDLASTLEALHSLASDEQVDEFPIVLNLNKKNIDEEKIRVHIDDFIKKHPDSSRGYYYLAAIDWKKNKNLDETKKLLKKALKINPKDPFIKETLKSIKNSKNKKPSFYFSIEFNMGDL
ncbi:MAG: hypothetical protein DRQ88_06895 [Epsilonproteobacteria bacterium]|nr:MAG: hypothetical protein DRQ89_05695 [Campylobacterota bacterium]RLA66362.1 MAG: hypothetical protein DRQ88_06895 [Campylobacterota bacterium]